MARPGEYPIGVSGERARPRHWPAEFANSIHCYSRANYLDDESYRRRILTQLNRGESRHGVARAIFHGQRGEVRQRYREGQEDQLGALGLVVNVVVLWNTLYMDAALDHLRRRGVETKPEDVARLSPLGHENINFLGRYSFALTESVARGELRPLHDPEETGGLAEPSAA